MGILVAKKRTILKIAQMLSNVGVNISDHKRHVLRFLIKALHPKFVEQLVYSFKLNPILKHSDNLICEKTKFLSKVLNIQKIRV